MDSLTHLALGACMGEAFAGKPLGRKALLWGAMAQSIPDIDFIAALWMPTAEQLLAHRGFTHSLLFCALIAPLFALLAERLHRPHNISLLRWLLFFGGVIFAHIFIDVFNNYGVGLLEPFSHQRFSFNAIYVIDPIFSIWPGLACVALLVLKRKNRRRKWWWQIGLGGSAAYLLCCLFNKALIHQQVKALLIRQQIAHTRYFTTPAPLQNFLWYVVAGNDSGYYTGFRSLLDRKPMMDLQYFPRNDALLRPLLNHEDLQQLIRFSQQYYCVEKWGDSLVFNDLRFGQIIGWQKPRGRFVFHYFLQHPTDNVLVVQRGRFEGWNTKTLQLLLQRLRGQ